MALTNYADLIASINGSAAWLHRGDVAAIAVDWVTLCETTINYGDPEILKVEGLRTSDQETIWTSASAVPAVTVANVQTVTLPTDFLQMRHLYVTANGVRRELTAKPITPMSVTQQAIMPGIPRHYWVVGNSIYLDPVPDQAYPLTGDYYAKIGPLATQSTNWLMTAAPAVYLSGAIFHGAPWLGPKFDPTPWATGFRVGMAQVARADARKRFSGMRQATSDFARMSGRSFDLVTGT